MFEAIMKAAAQHAAENAVNRENDYRNAEGLLICGICHTPKQMRLPAFTEGVVYCMCDCESKQYRQEQAEHQAMQDRHIIERMRAEAFRDSKFRHHTFARDDSADSTFSATARRYAEHFDEILQENCGLLLYGEPGTGKSFYAACIVNALIDRKISAFMTNVTEITRLCEPAQRDLMQQKLLRCDLVVMDDIGSERETEFALEQLYAAVDARYRSGKPLIVTTNYTPQQLQAMNDLAHRRIYDRICECCAPIEVKGARRKAAGRSRTELLSSILYDDASGNIGSNTSR